MEACNPKPKGVIPHMQKKADLLFYPMLRPKDYNLKHKIWHFSYLLQKFISNSYKIQLYIRVSRSTAWSNFILLLLKFTSHAFHHCKHSLVWYNML